MQQSRVEAPYLAFAAVLLSLFSSTFASEQQLLLRGGKWRNSKITISLARPAGPVTNIQGDLSQSLLRSLRAWSKQTNLTFDLVETDVQSVSPKGNKGDGVSLITTAATSENLRLFPRQAASPAAITRVFRNDRGFITEADIVLNPFVKFSTDGTFDSFDLQDTLTHEIGHLLGLEHISVWGSVMFERSPRSLGPGLYKGSRDDLPQVDAASIKALYGPRPEDVQCCGVISGRITGTLPTARVLLWVEEADTGRLIAAGIPDHTGSYRIEGVPEGRFVLFASSEEPSGDLASSESKIEVSVADETTRSFNLRSTKSDVRVHLLGATFQLAGLPVNISPNSQDLFLGSNGDTQHIARVWVSGSDISVEPKPKSNSMPLFRSVKVAAFGITTPLGLPAGDYTLVIEGNNGVRQYLVGALISR